MSTTLGELANLVDGELSGDGTLKIAGAATLADAGPGDITLIDGPEKLARLAGSTAAAAVVPAGSRPKGMPSIAVAEVHAAFTAIALHFRPPRKPAHTGVSPLASVAESASVGRQAAIHPGATVAEDVTIGDRVTIHAGAHVMAGCRIDDDVALMPGVVLYENTQIGPRVVIHAGAIIGAHGFGYQLAEGRHVPGAQLGHVQIEADVEIGANTTIDRGTYGPTVIGEGTKIDNLVMIAHNCRIGRHNMICSQVGIAGSSTTGDYVVMAGQVGVRDHVHIGTGAILGAMAGVSNDVPDGEVMIGIPATPQRDQKLKQAVFSKLPEMRKELKALRREIDELNSGPKAGAA